MNKLFYFIMGSFLIFNFTSCHEGLDFNKLKKNFQDSAATVLPSWQSITLKPENDGTEILLVIGDPNFYKTSDEIKKVKAVEFGKLILRLSGPDNYLTKGTLIITQNPKNSDENPADGIKVPMDFTALKK